MDSFRRLAFGLFMFASMVAMFAPRLARAAWEYTPKVAATTGGVPKEQGSTAAMAYYACSGWNSTVNATCSWSGTPKAGNQLSEGEMCAFYKEPFADIFLYSVTGTGGSSGQCQYRYNSAPSNPGPTMTWSRHYYCSAGTLSGTSCLGTLVCPSGTVEGAGGLCYALVCPQATPPWEADPADSSQCRRGQSCEPSELPDGSGGCVCPGAGAVTANASTFSADGTFRNDSFCFQGCVFKAKGGYAIGSQGSVSRTEWYGPFTTTGGDCTGTTGAGSADTKTCGVGQVLGTVNGQPVCVTAGTSDGSSSTSTTETKPNGTGGTIETTTTTTKTVNCVGDNCTETTTTTISEQDKDSNGANVGNPRVTVRVSEKPVTRDGDKPSDEPGTETDPFCKQNPEASICKGSAFSGSCPSFTCEGDAVVCAIAKEQHLRNCTLLESTGTLTTGNAATAFDEIRQFDATQLNGQPQAFGQGIAASSFLGGGCVQDVSVPIWGGKTLVIPFASLCPYLQAAGIAWLAVCGIIAFAVVRRGVEA